MVGDETDTNLAQAFLYNADTIQIENYISVFQCVIPSDLSTFLEKKKLHKKHTLCFFQTICIRIMVCFR